MAETPTTDPLRAQLGDDEWRRLTDERARLQAASAPTAPEVEAAPEAAPEPPVPNRIETKRSQLGYKTPDWITGRREDIAQSRALTDPIIQKAQQRSALRTAVPQSTRPARPTASLTPTAPSVSLATTPGAAAPAPPNALQTAARRAQQIGREQGLLAMYDDLRVPQEVTQGALQDVDLVSLSGKHMPNLRDVIGRLEQASYQRLLENDEVDPLSLTEEERQEYKDDATRIAARRLAAFQQSKMGRWFVDPYDEDVKASLRKWPRAIRPFVAMFKPTQFGGPGDISVEEGGLGRRAQIISSPTGLRGEGPLSQFARMALSTVWGSSIKTDGWGTDEQIDLQRRGYDILDEYSNIADFLDPTNEKGEDPSRLAKISSGALLLGVVLTDLDLVTVGLSPGGKIARTRKLGRIAGRLSRAEELLKIADEVESGAIDSVAAFEQIRNIAYRTDRSVGNAFANIITDTAAPQLGLSPAALSENAAKFLGEARLKRLRALELQEKATEALAKAQSERARVVAGEALAKATAQVHAADLARVAVAESNKNATLIALGLTAEEAASITTRKELQAVLPQGKERAEEMYRVAREAVARANKEAAEITEAALPINQFFDEWAATNRIQTSSEAGAGFGQDLLNGARRVVFRKTDVVDGTVGASPAGYIKNLSLVNKATGDTLPAGRKARRGAQYEVQAQVITDSGETVTIRLPGVKGAPQAALKGDAATTFSRNLKEFESIAIANHLNISSGTRALAAQKTAQNILDDFGLKGPMADVVRAFENATSSAKITERGVAASLKKLTAAQKRAVSKMIKSEKATIRAGRKMLEAETAARAPKVLAGSIREVAKGIRAFREQGLKALGAEDDALSFWDAWKLTRKAGKREIEHAFSSSAHEIPAAEKYKKLNNEFIEILDKSGQSKTAAGKILKDLKQSYGKDLVYSFVKEEGDLLGLLTKSYKGNLTGEETAKLQDALRRLTRLGEANKAWTSGAEFGAQFSNAWKSVTNFNPNYARKIKPGGLLSKVPVVREVYKNVTTPMLVHYWNRVKRTTDPMLSRVGQVSPEQLFILKATDNMISRYANEILDVTYARHLGNTPEERIIAYLDWDAAKNGPLQIRTDSKFMRGGEIRTPVSSPAIESSWQQATGLGSPFQKFVNQVLLDTRINPRIALEEAEKVAASRKILENTVGKKIAAKRRGLLKEGFSKAEIDNMVADFPDSLVLALSRSDGAAASAGVPKALLGISRMWMKAIDGNIDKASANALLGIARKLLAQEGVTYASFSRKMKGATKAIIGVTDSAPRAHAFGSANVGLGANLNHFNSLMTRSTLGTIDADQAIAINKVFSGELYRADNTKAALEGAALLGLPIRESKIFSPASKAAAENAAAATRELIEISSKNNGIFVPKNIIDDIEASLSSIVKELEFTTKGQRGAGETMASFYTDYLNIWKASVTTGLLIPNPRYFVNNIFGDFSQMWIELGAVPAAARSFSNLPLNVPFAGRRLQNWQLRMTEWAAVKGEDALPPIVGSFLNPHLSKIFRGEAGTVVSRGRGGKQVYTYDDVRRMAVEDGILSDMISEDVINAVSRAGKEMNPSMRKEWARTREMNAGMIQHRQRMGLYVDLLRKGVPREEAARRTLRALYDWKHGVTDLEMKIFGRISPFYRFWKLCVGQMSEALLTPFTRPTPELLKNAVTGNTRLGRIRQQLLIWNNLSDLAYKDDLDAGAYRNEMMERLAPSFHPRWASTRPTLGSRPYSIEARDLYQKLEGKNYTHATWSLPTVTVTDGMEMTLAIPLGLALLANKISGAEGGLDLLPGVDLQWTEDAEAHFFEPMLGATFPAVEFLGRLGLTTLGEGFGVDLEYAARGARRNVSPTDVASMGAVPIVGKYLENAIEVDQETGAKSIDVGRYLSYSMIPFFGTQIPAWLRGASDRATDPRLGGGMGKVFREITGFGRELPYDLQKEIDQTLMGIEQIIQRETRDVIAPNVGLYKARVDDEGK